MRSKGLYPLGLALALLAASVPAQEAGSDAPEPEAQEQTDESAPRERAPGRDVFRPSERISEDYPVPFPVDI